MIEPAMAGDGGAYQRAVVGCRRDGILIREEIEGQRDNASDERERGTGWPFQTAKKTMIKPVPVSLNWLVLELYRKSKAQRSPLGGVSEGGMR